MNGDGRAGPRRGCTWFAHLPGPAHEQLAAWVPTLMKERKKSLPEDPQRVLSFRGSANETQDPTGAEERVCALEGECSVFP